MKNFQRILALLSIVVSPSLLAAPVLHNGHYYDFVAGPTWTAAESNAVALGGHLVTINDAAEEAWLNTGFGLAGNQWWIGFNYVASVGNFVWSSGEPVTYTNWAPGKPDIHLGAEHYAVMNWVGAQWGNLPNVVFTRGIAEWSPVVSVPEPESYAMMLLGLGVLGFTTRRRGLRRI
ncbi:MAG: PEP-CTERM sorting domain-containing protein [Rhodocyclaceae bacterium]|nr:PEP-CTERM sorting domain-containing protein [Rhodocyclaceae bacterium]